LKRTLLFTFIHLFLLSLSGQNLYWQQQVNFTMDVALNDKDHSLEGFAKMEYINNSPDTLTYIWFHLWPNAFKNDQTSFSEQLLLNGRTHFYFSTKEERGYINRLDFKVNSVTARLEDHPNYIDVVKLLLPEVLLPGKSIIISTPFHVKLPKNFSRGGHVGQSYQVTQWYPKPAVYDRKGWHPMPYLDQGEFYSEFGNYDVRITVPDNYVVAATGELQNEDEKKWLKGRNDFEPPVRPLSLAPAKKKKPGSREAVVEAIGSSATTKTLLYRQDNIHDFAWFADKYLRVQQDTLMLESGKIIDVYSYYHPSSQKYWAKSIQYIKDAILTRSNWLGEYPYKVVSAAEMPMGFNGGMEYPTITSLSSMESPALVAGTIAHEVGHNWLYGILATNERQHPWMDEGMNTYYDNRFEERFNVNNGREAKKQSSLQKKLPQNGGKILMETLEAMKKDQPIELPSKDYTEANYGLVTYYKTGEWMKKLELFLGKTLFDSCMRAYYRQWQFKHPYPEDFKQVITSVSGKNPDQLFTLLTKTGNPDLPAKKKLTPALLINFNETNRKNYLSFLPLAGYNLYDGLMLGSIVHNYQLPLNRVQFFATALYGTRSKELNWLGRVAYHWLPENKIYKTEIGIATARFSGDSYQPAQEKRLFLGFTKLAPFIRVTLKEKNLLSQVQRYIQFKTFFIAEDALDFRRVTTTTDTFDVVSKKNTRRYLNQLKWVVENSRALYPYRGELQIEQGEGFLRTAFTGNYFLNYSRGNGARVRFFVAKFSYLGKKTQLKQFQTSVYHPKLTAVRGFDDYTYSNYFVGRNGVGGGETGVPDQQVMMRDGGLKIRTDIFSGLQGRSDNWVTAINLSTPIPKELLPIPLIENFRLFLDIGTYAESWKPNAPTSRFLYTGGLQLSLFNDGLNIYWPFVYNKEIKANLKSVPEENKRKISFSIDIQNFRFKKLDRTLPF
jgi:hypothetical protein